MRNSSPMNENLFVCNHLETHHLHQIFCNNLEKHLLHVVPENVYYYLVSNIGISCSVHNIICDAKILYADKHYIWQNAILQHGQKGF